jgi:hypothetical protein
MTNISDIARAQSDNWKNGPAGVDPAVMEDLGYTPFDKMPEVFESFSGRSREQLEPKAAFAGQVICGDCGEVIPCSHADGSSTFDK